MSPNKKIPSIDIVWFKRDLRTLDNKSLEIVAQSSNPVLFIYLFEPSVMDYPDYDKRHFTIYSWFSNRH